MPFAAALCSSTFQKCRCGTQTRTCTAAACLKWGQHLLLGQVLRTCSPKVLVPD